MDEDMILPEGFDESTPQDVETQEETLDDGAELLETGEDTKPPVEEEQPPEVEQTPQKIKIKFNHEERELDLEEAAQLAQKGMVFDKAVERARQEAAQQAKDAVIAEMGWRDFDGQPITTEARYREVMREKEIREKYSDLPEEVREELIASRADREERQREKAANEAKAKEAASFNEFFEYFQSVNDRPFDPQKDTIPPEVQAAVDRGETLKYAYMEHHNKELRNRLKIASQNQQNKQKAPVGGVTVNGGTRTASSDPFMEGFNSI